MLHSCTCLVHSRTLLLLPAKYNRVCCRYRIQRCSIVLPFYRNKPIERRRKFTGQSMQVDHEDNTSLNEDAESSSPSNCYTPKNDHPDQTTKKQMQQTDLSRFVIKQPQSCLASVQSQQVSEELQSQSSIQSKCFNQHKLAHSCMYYSITSIIRTSFIRHLNYPNTLELKYCTSAHVRWVGPALFGILATKMH